MVPLEYYRAFDIDDPLPITRSAFKKQTNPVTKDTLNNEHTLIVLIHGQTKDPLSKEHSLIALISEQTQVLLF